MSRSLLCYLFLTVWFVDLDGKLKLDRPTISTSNGDLVLEPAFDKNIYLRINGPKSSVFVGDINLSGLNATSASAQYVPSSNTGFEKYLNGPNGILQRLERLENRNLESQNGLLFNVSVLSRKINRQSTMLLNLRNRINERAKDECQSRPCSNGGTCLNLVNGYYCLCPPNWEGQDCDIDVNECRNFAGTDLGCQNGATCLNRPGTYECLCRSGWFGLHCTRKAKDCSGGNYEMCGHGTCIPVPTGDGIKCICDQGWTTNETGVACLTDINECDSSQGPRCSVNPRVDCINLPGTFRCGQCPPGFEGDGYVCSDIDECLTTINGGCSTSPMVTCHNTIGSRICGSCPPGYQGDGITCSWRGSCSINRGGCHPSAQCIDNPALGGQIAQCICPIGMDGDGIGLHGCYIRSRGNDTRGCESNPCGVNGQCHPLRIGYTCICTRGFSGAHCDVSSSYCVGNPCLNGGSCRPDDRTLRGFRCECTPQFTGDLCHLASKNCGGMLQAEEGSILYPLSANISYNHNSRCAWVIRTDADKVINVTFSKFNLESSPECQYDFLQIHDGGSSASQIIGRFCGTSFPKGGNIISTHNLLYFWFRSDQTVSKDGFALHWTSITPTCGGEVDATVHGHIHSPGSPGKYPPNRDCYWHLTTTYGKRIQLHFFALDIESHSNCSFDYIAIYDGAHTSDPLINRYCNSTQPAPIQSAGSEMLIHFHSDAYASGNGFQIAFAQTEGVPGCGGFFTAERGEIASPSYDGQYMANLVCEYKIRTSPDTKIRLKFKSFKLEKSVTCRFDYLKIYDGPSSDSGLIGKFCGTTYPKSDVVSKSNTLYIKFYTDVSIQSEGFRIAYESVCQQTLLVDSGVIKSPGYPENYPENRVCEYIIGTSPGKVIQLVFQDFDIEDNRYYNCQYDNVEIRDGFDVNATLLGRYCGNIAHIPPVTISTHNYLYVKFNSDLSISGTGFYANYTTIPTECGGIYRENVGLINFPSDDKTTYQNDQSCSWILIAPEGMHIKLVWNRFELESSAILCRNDYVQIIEVDDDSENSILGTYCGTTLPPAITSSRNQLQIKFVSDSSIRSTGFSVQYSFLDGKLHCGGSYSKSHGTIYSPGWPNRYENSRNCVWKIVAPVGQQIQLNIVQFDLERPMRNKCDNGDYLEIRNGHSETSPLIGKYCGNFESKRITSFGNSMYLRFFSDSYISGNGFKIEWDSTITGCGGVLTSANGSISSPNYPEQYNDNAECFYKIVTSAGSRIHISFRELELERTMNCRDDYVEIFDGLNQNSPSLGKHCSMSNKLYNIETSTNNAFIKFRSDFFLGGKGFLLEYYTVCQNNLTGIYGMIESPGYPNNYPLNLNCLWTINVPKGNKVNITFTHFSIFRQYYDYYRPMFPNRINIWSRRTSTSLPYGSTLIRECGSDYLQMKDTSDANFGSKYCGTALPPKVSSKTNSFQIRFITDDFFASTGFHLEWVRYGCGGHIQKSYGSISLDKSLTSNEGEMECEWLIETPTGTSVTITISNLYMTDSANCTTDALEIYNGQSLNTPLISKICHRGMSTIQSTTNFMLIRFIKRSSLKDVYFDLVFHSYRAGCGSTIDARSGMIYSQNYPKNYDNNLDCVWTLEVPINHRIELNFMDFDLYSNEDSYDENECGDHIKIYDGSVFKENYTQRICPNANVSQIISKKNSVQLQFITDGYGTAKGFKANFTMTCGATITAHYDGIIKNDMFVGHSNKNCTWTILAPSLDQKISLTITHMSIPKNSDIITNRHCPSSFLRVFDGDDDSAPLIDEYCGRKVPPMVVSHGSAITIQLSTYSGSVAGQFSAHYTALTSACGGDLTSEEGTIASPNYPQSYPVSTSCEWTLSTSPGNRVYIAFELMDLDYSENCNEDYLEVRENNGAGKLLGLYCGSEIPTNATSASKLYIRFHSDNKNAGRGFLIHYGFLHGNEVTGLESGQITSPLYPSKYDGAGDYFWRIVLNDSGTITINVNSLEIPVHGPICYNSLVIYDGYDADAPVLNEFCGKTDTQKILQTSSNVAFIRLKLDDTNIGSNFNIYWAKTNKNIESEDDNINCGFNDTQIMLPGQNITFSSPNYPSEYRNDLNCKWVFSSPSGYHLSLKFNEIEIEQLSSCFADFISIYSSDNSANWKPVKENICLSDYANQESNVAKFLKVKFHTDSSITRKGFQGTVRTMCGGLVTELSGTIGPTWADVMERTKEPRPTNRCDWTIKVRPGRVIKLYFDYFNITNREDNCITFVTIRNGDSVEAPLLNSGKYCGYSHENKVGIESSSNAVFVSYVNNYYYDGSSVFQTFKLRYEEKNFECGVTSKLDGDHKWEVFNSPNYPSIPVPYSECVFVFTGPPGEILRLDFLERFDLATSEDCTTEFVEIRDGYSDASQLRGRYCSEKPGTIKSSNNVIYIKYFTQLAEPRNGFKANVSIDICGGTIVATKGELSSPGYPHMPALPYGSVCEWRITGFSRLVYKIYAQDIDLPDSELPCATKITIEEIMAFNNTVTILKTFCPDDDFSEPIESSTNELIVKLHIGKPSEYRDSDGKGFRFTFNSTRPVCGGITTTSEGYLTTPAYPLETTIRYCQWLITVPDVTRRVRLELLDIDTENHKVGMFNDPQYQSIIQILPSTDLSLTTNVFESSGNKLALYVWLNNRASRHRFKARFSSDEEALCGGSLSGITGELVSPSLERSYTCDWRYKFEQQMNSDSNSSELNTMYINVKVNSSITRRRCRFSDARLNLKSPLSSTTPYAFVRTLCGSVDTAYRVPSTVMDFKATKNNFSSLYFHLEWKLQPCGGIIHVGENPVNILNIPNDYNDTLDCAWFVGGSTGDRVEMKLEGDFQLQCADEFVQVNQGVDQYAANIGDYCKDRTQAQPLVTPYRYMLVQYHSEPKTNSNIKLMARVITNQCGGYLTRYENIFASPNYPKSYDSNIECTWEIKADLGYRISLQFIERFVIEDRVNCTKDAVIIYDWKDDEYTEIARVCGRQPPAPKNSTYNQMKVVLRTDNEINLDGFKAMWIPICGAKYIATEKEQILYSPGYPDHYLSSLDCSFEISSDKKVFVKFLDFEFEGTYPACEYDNLTVIARSGYDVFEQVYCGNEMPPPLQKYENVKLTLKTDRYIQRKGFKLSYGVYACGGKVTEPTVLSSGPVSSYDDQLNCTWSIQAPDTKKVILRFQYIDLESRPDCFADYLAVFNGLQIKEDKRIALLCGSINSTTVLRSSGNTMLLQFVTDYSITLTGFKVEVLFTYSESVGCGGQIELTPSTYTLKSPLLNGSRVYENFLDCYWTIKAPVDQIIRIEFTSFHILSCPGVNQTAIGIENCNCDLVEIKDGINPNSISIGKYCGHTLPPPLLSSGNFMSIRLETDGVGNSAGFEARLTLQRSLCGPSFISITGQAQSVKSPGYETGSVPRGIYCVYNFDMSSEPYATMQVTVKNLDLQAGFPEPHVCNRDKLTIKRVSSALNNTIGKDFIMNSKIDDFYHTGEFDESTIQIPEHYELCGVKQSTDFYLSGSVSVILQTSPDSDSTSHKGFEIEAFFAGPCGRNYTESQGRIRSTIDYRRTISNELSDCYTLITAPENYTISVYFIAVNPVYWSDQVYLDVYDGDKTTTSKSIRIDSEFQDNIPIFSTGRYLLFHHHFIQDDRISYDLSYVTTDKGRGCGGKLENLLGKFTSPLYPKIFRQKGSCEWEVETPVKTRVRLHFPVFDLGRSCDQNFVQLVDRQGTVYSTYCSETPADFTSNDNYVKVVFTTTMNNGGTGWVAEFIAVL